MGQIEESQPINNKIKSTKVKESWTRDEVIKELHLYREFIWKNGATVQDLDKYIKENL